MNQLNYPLSLALVGMFLGSMVAQHIPIPVVKRDRTQPATVFTKPALVVAATVLEKRFVEERNIDGKSFPRPRVHRLVSVALMAVLRTNERLPTHPNLAGRHFFLDMKDTDVELTFGKTYVLMVNYAPEEPGASLEPKSPPSYVLALEDVGFETDGNLVHVLRRGGALSAYDGMLTSDLFEAIKRGR